MGHFKNFEQKKVGNFMKLARDQLKKEKEPKMEFCDFETFRKNMVMLLYNTIILHMLFWHFIILPGILPV